MKIYVENDMSYIPYARLTGYIEGERFTGTADMLPLVAPYSPPAANTRGPTYQDRSHELIKALAESLREFIREYDYNASMEDRFIPDPAHVARARELLQ